MDQIITLGQSGSNLALGVTEARNVNAVKSFSFFLRLSIYVGFFLASWVSL